MKAGTRVRYIYTNDELEKRTGFYPPIGTLGTVIEIGGNDILVKWDSGTIGDGEWWCGIADVERVE